MIFVTVGTHEQQFNRLIEAVDNLCADHIINEPVIIQTGFSDYIPKYCTWKKLFSYQEMIKNIEDARIVITHGGPSSFIMPLQVGKTPVVVPRRAEYGEHVNDHQESFVVSVKKRFGNIIVVEDISELKSVILNYDTIIKGMTTGIKNNNSIFCAKFEEIVQELFEKKG